MNSTPTSAASVDAYVGRQGHSKRWLWVIRERAIQDGISCARTRTSTLASGVEAFSCCWRGMTFPIATRPAISHNRRILAKPLSLSSESSWTKETATACEMHHILNVVDYKKVQDFSSYSLASRIRPRSSMGRSGQGLVKHSSESAYITKAYVKKSLSTTFDLSGATSATRSLSTEHPRRPLLAHRDSPSSAANLSQSQSESSLHMMRAMKDSYEEDTESLSSEDEDVGGDSKAMGRISPSDEDDSFD